MQYPERQDEDMALKKRTDKPCQAESAVPTHPPQRLIEITHPDTPVRFGPGTQYTAHMVAHLGDRLMCADTAGWLPVNYINGIAWVQSKAVDVRHDAAITKTQTTLYSGPGTHYAPIRQIAPRRSLRHSIPLGWYPVLNECQVFWISRKYTKEVRSADAPTEHMTASDTPRKDIPAPYVNDPQAVQGGNQPHHTETDEGSDDR